MVSTIPEQILIDKNVSHCDKRNIENSEQEIEFNEMFILTDNSVFDSEAKMAASLCQDGGVCQTFYVNILIKQFLLLCCFIYKIRRRTTTNFFLRRRVACYKKTYD